VCIFHGEMEVLKRSIKAYCIVIFVGVLYEKIEKCLLIRLERWHFRAVAK
jgi:hypothetical protein